MRDTFYMIAIVIAFLLVLVGIFYGLDFVERTP